jgi:FkbM family methyltransferase
MIGRDHEEEHSSARARVGYLVAGGWDLARAYVPHVGWLWHERGDGLLELLRQGSHDARQQAFAWLYLRSGDVVLDGGAHVGLYSILAARATRNGARVIAVEPNPPTADLLELNLQENAVHGSVDRRALWRAPTALRLEADGPGRSFAARVAFAPGRGRFDVSATTIDAILAEHGAWQPALINVDLGGAEPEAIEGAAQTLAGAARPVWMIGFAERSLQQRGFTAAQLGELLARKGLVLCELDEDSLQLVPASTERARSYTKLLATRDPDAVNLRLRGAPERNLEIARDILSRARACQPHLDAHGPLRAVGQPGDRWAREVQPEPVDGASAPAEASARAAPGDAPDREPRVDVCICTHNPRPAVLDLVIAALARQTVGPRVFRVLVVDNASTPPLDEAILSPLRARGIEAAIAREEQPGVLHARVHAAREVRAPWALFVDDDNVLSDDYVAEGLTFAAQRSYVGCFGGKLLLPETIRAPRWVEPFLRYLGIKDEGDAVLVGPTHRWGPWEPPGAGSWVRREQLLAFVARVERDERTALLGRKRRDGLASREDSLIAHAAKDLGLLAAYNPRLWLLHHLDPKRFERGYLYRLLYGYGTSHVLFEVLTGPPGAAPPRTPRRYRGLRFFRELFRNFNRGRKESFEFGVGLVMYERGIREAYRRLERGEG